MPKKPPTIDTSKLNQIDTYTYPEYDRANIPPVGMAQYDTVASPEAKYEYDPHIDPSLQWSGKKEGASFTVPTSSIHIHESIKPHKIIRSVQTLGEDYKDDQGWLFESDADIAAKLSNKFEFYQHKDKWTNRLVAGDSLVIMNSMLEKEGMVGQVQMVYIDPPYGIKYGSNFQPFVNKRDVKDKKDEDLNTEPEMIKAFRDTWELGIHSYLTYLRDRLLLARELLSDIGSVFVQINDTNLHHIRELCDEIFGSDNFFSQISFKKTLPLGSTGLAGICDYIIWYAKDISQIKYHELFESKPVGEGTGYTWLELTDGVRRKMTKEEKNNPNLCPSHSKLFFTSALASSGYTETCMFDFEFNKKIYKCGKKSWRTTKEGIEKLINENRIIAPGDLPCYIQYHDDFPFQPLHNLWNDTHGATDMQYVVQTSIKPIQRCLLMTTDPGDLVLDITCGSGTTAYVAEQWGRRWITCDTSRIAVTLAKKRLMTATFNYYKLAHPDNGVSSGFVYKTVPHVTLKSIANNEPPQQETLYDQPEIEKKKIRISGPFTVEALPSPVVKPLESDDTLPAPFFHENAAKKQADWMQELKATGLLGRGGEKIKFARVEALETTKFLHGIAETDEKERKHAVICFAGETRPLDVRMVNQALNEMETIRPKPSYVLFAAFQFDPTAAKLIDDTKWPGVTLLKVQMNTDLMTGDLKKKQTGNQSFWLIGQPDVELIKIEKGEDKGKHKIKVKGFDYYDVKKGIVESGGTEKIAMWMLDTDYDGMCIEPRQVFFPMEGKNEGWDKLAKTLKAEIDQDLIEKYRGVESLPFAVKDNTAIAVKIVDDRGIECLKVISVGKNNG
ncbi:MAG: site-specific DNA-methyltransferase [Treponema sp.]|nr:site-specific DNA-methyltransferase [Treponema sp.]